MLSPVTHFLPSTLHYLLNLLPTTPKHPLLTLLYASTTPLPASLTKLCQTTAHSPAIPHPRVSWEQTHLPTLSSMHHSRFSRASTPTPAESHLVPSPAVGQEASPRSTIGNTEIWFLCFRNGKSPCWGGSDEAALRDCGTFPPSPHLPLAQTSLLG